MATRTHTVTNPLGSAVLLTGTLMLSSALTAPANAFEVEQGPRGGSRIVNRNQAEQVQPRLRQEAQVPKAQAPKAKAQGSTILIQQGSHGAHRLITKKGVGGPAANKGYEGFPDLEGTAHQGETWSGDGWVR